MQSFLIGSSAVTAAGSSLEATANSLLGGSVPVSKEIDGAQPFRLFEVEAHDSELSGFSSYSRRMDRYGRLLLEAVEQALTAAVWNTVSKVPPERRAIVAGVGFGGTNTMESSLLNLHTHGRHRVHPLSLLMSMPSGSVAMVAERIEARGEILTLSSACASGSQCVDVAQMLLQTDRADMVLCVASESPRGNVPAVAFSRLGAINAGDVQLGEGPFSVGRNGFNLGEGAAAVVLVNESGLTSDLTPEARILGTASSSDSYHLTAPDPSGASAEWCVRRALELASLDICDVSHINLHGTATLENDRVEADIVNRIFAGALPPCFSLKSSLGHSIAASGLVELVVSIECLKRGKLPGTVGSEPRDPDINLPITQHWIPADGSTALSHSFAFGGQNSAILVGVGDAMELGG